MLPRVRSAWSLMGACLPIAIGWNGQSHSGFWQLAQAENTMALDGLKTIPSHFGTKETIDRLEAEIKAKGLTVFARIDHAAGAAAVGMSLRPTELLIFGNARGGTPLMQADQRIGIDLPLKALAYPPRSLCRAAAALSRPLAVRDINSTEAGRLSGQ